MFSEVLMLPVPAEKGKTTPFRFLCHPSFLQGTVEDGPAGSGPEVCVLFAFSSLVRLQFVFGYWLILAFVCLLVRCSFECLFVYLFICLLVLF
jgi:hypothetical protein